jgi:hypothetical protein
MRIRFLIFVVQVFGLWREELTQSRKAAKNNLNRHVLKLPAIIAQKPGSSGFGRERWHPRAIAALRVFLSVDIDYGSGCAMMGA